MSFRDITPRGGQQQHQQHKHRHQGLEYEDENGNGVYHPPQGSG
eukprot:CAMPEP_0172556748 /NCGR_PEP_ID=MMETSP1067-20121228/68643_1 /TAXON_ID=265564 ORGANISM="Thalassiosira punctigera, Strain Tpunct2005C2" /NCGR_SAMPLE_ID=MMETSP1067 /ASSEMBLY_ACC=CAM_ASM_000444 /LENGTH=43 /DNA_ID= /DNA_START= /DNA_END= /DNA_ORIENTATION=